MEFDLEEYTLDDLVFEPPSVVIEVDGKTKKFWLKPPNETERQMAQNAARAQSRALRKELEDKKSEKRQLLIDEEINNLSEDELRMLWTSKRLFNRIFEAQRTSLENRDDYFVPAPVGPDGEDGIIPPTPEQMDRYEDEKEESEKRRQEELAASQKQAAEALQIESKAVSHKDLISDVVPNLIDQFCQREWNAEYGVQLVTRGTFLDKRLNRPAFKTADNVKALLLTEGGRKIVEELTRGHLGMQLDPDKVKNSEGDSKLLG